MKKLILLSLVCSIAALPAIAQEPTNRISPVKTNNATMAPAPDSKFKSNCCAANPHTLTACAQSLFQSFKNLTAGVGVSICNTTLNYPSVSFAMPENCFSHQTGSTSMVTFTSFYAPGATEFRVIWGATPGSFSYYGVCAPDPIIFPHPGVIENHVFAAKLIKQTDYKAFPGSPKDYTTMAAVASVAPSDIQQIVSVYMEEQGDYISTAEAADYNNIFSSKGIVVKVKLKSGPAALCYVINNYDGGGTINWKEKNPACVK